MSTSEEFRQFAYECLQWADKAKTEAERKTFRDMARSWTQAALRLEGVLVPDTIGDESLLPAPQELS